MTPCDYRALADFRFHVRRYLRFSERAARAAGLQPRQHQLLLALVGLPTGARPTIRTMAERLQSLHHSTVELVDRLVRRGLLRRLPSAADRREVLLDITPQGRSILDRLSRAHRAELRALVPDLREALRLLETPPERGLPGAPKEGAQT